MGTDGILWKSRPDFALVLASSCPSGLPEVVRLRAAISKAMFHSLANEPHSSAPARVRHQSTPSGGGPAAHIYVGCGVIDSQLRPSLWADPFWLVAPTALDCLVRYSDYLDSRSDLVSFLSPLAGKILICDCSLKSDCHARVLVDRVNLSFPLKLPGLALPRHLRDPVSRSTTNSLNLASGDLAGCPIVSSGDPACLDDVPDESDDEGWPSPPPGAIDEIVALNETIRGGVSGPHSERPGWLPSWFELIRVVRSAPEPIFWEIFSGSAGLTKEFVRQGWTCGPPIDVIFNPDFDCLNPGFVGVVIGLILERRVRVLHVGPPCASFSMAVNRFPQYAMRSKAFPDGFREFLLTVWLR